MKQIVNALWSEIYTQKKKNQDLVPILRDVAIFEGLTTKELMFIGRILHQRTYSPKELIFKEGEAGNGMYIIKTGNVVIFSEETQTEYAKLTAGTFFGELSLVDGAPRSASAKSKDDCKLFGFFKPDLLSLMEKNHHIGSKVLMNLSRVLSTRLRNTNQQWLELQKEVSIASK
tara:strand:- start:2052 stop:2570 length:519 start_codon:yes stop_codon:yes gene_type:complete